MKQRIPHNFCGLSREFSAYENAEIVILPVPFDKTSTWKRGARRGPGAVISASRYLELFDIETGREVYRRGIHTAPPVRAPRSDRVVEKVHKTVSRLLSEKRFVVVLGGDHSVSIGSVKAHIEVFDDLSVLHLDAHTDMREHYEGDRFSHACTMARVRELTPHIVSVGIRSSDITERDAVEKITAFYAHEIHGQKKWKQAVHRALTPHVYVTIDVDVFDTGIMPSTGTPEPGGLDWYEVTELLKTVSEHLTIVGFDVVELIGKKNRSCDFLAAKLVYTLLSSIKDEER
jgi:agmatinase